MVSIGFVYAFYFQCYLCKQPVNDYDYFYSRGGTPTATRLIPLWSDGDELHKQEIANAAAKAREDLAKQDLTLKHDPTRDIAFLPATRLTGLLQARSQKFSG